MIELRRCVGVRGVEREICGVSYETSSRNLEVRLSSKKEDVGHMAI